VGVFVSATMKKVFLDIGFDYDFLLLGIVSQEKAHRLVWFINKELSYHFAHDGELTMYEEEKPVAAYTKYVFTDEINHLEFFMIENKDESSYLIPELRQIDFFIMIKGALDFLDVKTLITNMKPIQPIQLITEIDHQKLKSKQNLIF
jgi:hypothetical protein